MKRKIIASIIILLVLIMGIASYIVFNNENKIVSTITLDINPSIKINLTKNEKIVSVVALNDDAKKIVSNDLKGKRLDTALNVITDKVIKEGFVEEENLVILVHSTGSIDNDQVVQNITSSFDNNHIHAEIVVVKEITKDDEELAKKYNVSPAKAAYINSLVKENDKLDIEVLAGKSVTEITETKRTGHYCDAGYVLDGGLCLKEIDRIAASDGKVCPEGYYEYQDTCYKEIPIEDGTNFTCREEFTLDKNKCYRDNIIAAQPAKFTCNSGEAKTKLELGLTYKEAGDANDILCVDTSNATHPVSPCELNDGTEYTVAGGICYWHRAPILPEGCPGKQIVNGECWDNASNILICAGARDGKQYSSRDEFCEGTINYIEPVVTEYKCEEGFKLNGTMCTRRDEEEATREKVCPEGYTKTDNDRCIDYNNTENKVDGLVCDAENMRLRGNVCIVYEVAEAKHN